MMLLRGGRLIDPHTDRDGFFDVLLEKGRVKDVQEPGVIPESAAEMTLELNSKWILPGLIDLHVHLRDPGQMWKGTIRDGSIAAVCGGYTSICCMPNTVPANDSAEVTEYILDRAKSVGAARVLPIGAVSIGLAGKEMAPLSELRKAGCVAFSDDGEPVHDSGLMRRALEWCQMLDVPISCHEEDKHLSCKGSMNESRLSHRLGLRGMPTVAEDVMVARDIEIARYTGGKIHICHVSSGRSVELIRRAKNDGIRVTAEVTPHHLLLSEECVSEYDTHYKMSPPLRSDEDIVALREGLSDGTIDAIASDHAPHEADSKRVEFERATMGILGLQTSLPLLLEFYHNGSLSRSTLASLLSTGPAKIFGLDAGSLRPGAVADICVVDPDHPWIFDRDSLKTKSWNSPFLGKSLKGIADTVLVGGKIVVQDKECKIV